MHIPLYYAVAFFFFVRVNPIVDESVDGPHKQDQEKESQDHLGVVANSREEAEKLIVFYKVYKVENEEEKPRRDHCENEHDPIERVGILEELVIDVEHYRSINKSSYCPYIMQLSVENIWNHRHAEETSKEYQTALHEAIGAPFDVHPDTKILAFETLFV